MAWTAWTEYQCVSNRFSVAGWDKGGFYGENYSSESRSFSGNETKDLKSKEVYNNKRG